MNQQNNLYFVLTMYIYQEGTIPQGQLHFLFDSNMKNQMKLNNLLDDNSSNDVDHIVNRVNYIFI
jgi:hypothetical protein